MMTKITPSDDAIALAAAQLASALTALRSDLLQTKSLAEQEKYLMGSYRWAVTALVHERNA